MCVCSIKILHTDREGELLSNDFSKKKINVGLEGNSQRGRHHKKHRKAEGNNRAIDKMAISMMSEKNLTNDSWAKSGSYSHLSTKHFLHKSCDEYDSIWSMI